MTSAQLRAASRRLAPICLALLALSLLAAALFAASPARAETGGFTPTRFTVTVSGEGKDVIFIPGLATSRGVWQDAAGRLGPGYRVHLVQVKGFGEPAGPNAEGPVLEALVAELARYITENGLDRPAVVGHSLGGLAALMLGIDHPALPGRLMIVDAFPWYGVTVTQPGAQATAASIEPQARMMRDALVASYGTPQPPEQTEAAIARYVLDPSKLPLLREWTAGADPRVVGQLVYEDLITDLRTRIADIEAPLTLIYPWNERYPTREQAEAFYGANYAALPRAELVAVGPAAHFVMTDQPDAFQATLEEFLAD